MLPRWYRPHSELAGPAPSPRAPRIVTAQPREGSPPLCTEAGRGKAAAPGHQD